ncbi:MAG: histidine kinase [Gammaproteobacteria bacterium]
MTDKQSADDICKLVHDSKACLNSISMNAELVKVVTTRGHDPQKVSRLMDVIIRQCQQCSEILEDYRAAGRS